MMTTNTTTANEISTAPYNSGQYWIFNNGQYGEKTAITLQDHYSLQIIDGKVTGLYFHQTNNCGGRLNSCCYSIYNLSGIKAEMFNKLLATI